MANNTPLDPNADRFRQPVCQRNLHNPESNEVQYRRHLRITCVNKRLNGDHAHGVHRVAHHWSESTSGLAESLRGLR